ncbi:MAG: hypothetical protein LBI14_09290 [Treponema sp.]|jgi:hypothetical protein|nr:hypothetical protein [Treponema sp.]
MKKLFLFVVLVCVMAVSAFAQTYTVQSVSGRVQREANGVRVDVKVGDILTAQTIIHTGIGAVLTLNDGSRTLTVPAARSGTVADLSVAASGVRISGNVSQVDTNAVNRTTGQVSTASARASSAAQDEDISAE